jgi:hypothetical protein
MPEDDDSFGVWLGCVSLLILPRLKNNNEFHAVTSEAAALLCSLRSTADRSRQLPPPPSYSNLMINAAAGNSGLL